jgi:antitoxin (DNA-binding transcriptional repressor) of toxin-antitoxin stability system
MKQANVSILKNNLSQYLDYVRKGGVVRVFDRDRPVAELVPLRAEASNAPTDLAAIFATLERQGIVRRGAGTIPAPLLRETLPAADKSVLAALLDERREGR